ncbi:HPr family phosphocarrier protein [Clostridium polynesiense]|uniref:HPr family phosphocarrier protein n=1 Tax=Clostridium polynesiense TaxID=1325933 RepID=UPI0005903362|nr:HPr family phosphocarrier protein [Clostridium polynesiense]
MIEKKILIKNKTGIHSRPANQLVKLCSKFKSNVNIISDGDEINAKSIIALLSAGICQGANITLKVEGEDEAEAINTIYSFIDGLIE